MTNLEEMSQFRQQEETASLPQTSSNSRIDYLSRVAGNASTTFELFDKHGTPTGLLKDALLALPLVNPHTGRHMVTELCEQGLFDHAHVEEMLQNAFFKPNAAKFSFEIASDSVAPSEEQLRVFKKLGLIDAITVPAGQSYDTGVVPGGLLGAIDSRTRNLLEQGARLSSVALLGGQRKIIPSRESGDALKKVIGEVYYKELEENHSLPETEFDLMQCVWESYCRRDESLRSVPVITINSDLRRGHIKEAPGTPETVVDLANTLVSGFRVPGLEGAPGTFLLSSSQPHTLRQREDFLAAFALLSYPGLEQVDVAGYSCPATTSLKLYGSEIAKLVHSQFIARHQ